MKKQVFSCKRFTLVELVVIVSLSVLMLTVTMLITGCGESSGSSRSSASSGSTRSLDTAKNRTRCINNLKQLGLVVMMYADDNNACIPIWDGEGMNEPASNSNKLYDTVNAVATVTPGNKILLQGYMGMKLTAVDKNSAKKTFHCPSDEDIFDGKKASSYVYMPIMTETSHAKRRMIIGRDNPGAALMYDMHSTLVSGNTGGAAELPKKGGNHFSCINALYLGGHTGTVNVKTNQKITFQELDHITY